MGELGDKFTLRSLNKKNRNDDVVDLVSSVHAHDLRSYRQGSFLD
jgi:hypothetical protein